VRSTLSAPPEPEAHGTGQIPPWATRYIRQLEIKVAELMAENTRIKKEFDELLMDTMRVTP
jgi:uncharacterized protein YjaZ